MALKSLDALEKRLYEGAKKAFTKVMHAHSEEGIYSLAFFTSGSLGYLSTSCSTIEGLKFISEQYQGNVYFSDVTFQDIQKELKWSTCDSPYHLAFGDDIDVDDLMNELSMRCLRLSFDCKEDEASLLRRKVEEVLIRVLKRLDKEGVFGNGIVRENIVVNILKGDQSGEEQLYFAKQLNKTSIFERFRDEMLL